MLLTITTTHRPAGELGFLLHKHPGRCQGYDLSFGRVHVFYPEVSDERCTACLLLDIDPVGIVRGRGSGEGLLAQYVNDRPYAASSFLSVAIAQVYGSALQGRCRDRPELTTLTMPLSARIDVLPVRGGERFLRAVFEPLGYAVAAERHPLDDRFPEWGESPYWSVTVSKTTRLADLLTHLYVLIPVFDNQKHYFVGPEELEKLLAKGSGWLAGHPEKEEITRRYLKFRPSLYREALARLVSEEQPVDAERDERPADVAESLLETPLSLHEQRLGAVVAALRSSGARRVLDLGCGEGKLLRALLEDPQFEEIVGLDVSIRSLETARERLKLDRLPEKQAGASGCCTGRSPIGTSGSRASTPRRLSRWSSISTRPGCRRLRGSCSGVLARDRSLSRRRTANITCAGRQWARSGSAIPIIASNGRARSSRIGHGASPIGSVMTSDSSRSGRKMRSSGRRHRWGSLNGSITSPSEKAGNGMGTYRPKLMEAVTASDRMNALCTFIEFWLGPRQASYGESAQALSERSLPMPLKRLYEFAGRWPHWGNSESAMPAFSHQDGLVAMEDLKSEDDGKIVFLWENQGNWSCRTLPEGDDPPVWCYGELPGEDEQGGMGEMRVCDSLSRFLVTFVLQELTFGSRFCLRDEGLNVRFESERDRAIPVWTDGPYVDDSVQNYDLWEDVIVAEIWGYYFAANHPEGVEFLTVNQGPVLEIHLRIRLMIFQPWELDIRSDGSARVQYPKGESSENTELPAGTFDFPDVLQALSASASASEEGHHNRYAVLYLRRQGQSGAMEGKRVPDRKLVTSLFEIAIERVSLSNPVLQHRFQTDWPL